jgi:hypothetical protein
LLLSAEVEISVPTKNGILEETAFTVDKDHANVSSKRQRRAYYVKKALGHCTRCGQSSPGKTVCATCLARRVDHHKKLKPSRKVNPAYRAGRILEYYARKASGLCVNCAQATTRGRVLCDLCRASCVVARKQRIADGLCVKSCGRSSVPGKTQCFDCSLLSIWTSSRTKAKAKNYAPIAVSFDSFVQWFTARAHNTACDWCGELFVSSRRQKQPVIDHDHTTGELRALICHECNLVEGYGISRLRKVVAAIDKWNIAPRHPLAITSSIKKTRKTRRRSTRAVSNV